MAARAANCPTPAADDRTTATITPGRRTAAGAPGAGGPADPCWVVPGQGAAGPACRRQPTRTARDGGLPAGLRRQSCPRGASSTAVRAGPARPRRGLAVAGPAHRAAGCGAARPYGCPRRWARATGCGRLLGPPAVVWWLAAGALLAGPRPGPGALHGAAGSPRRCCGFVLCCALLCLERPSARSPPGRACSWVRSWPPGVGWVAPLTGRARAGAAALRGPRVSPWTAIGCSSSSCSFVPDLLIFPLRPAGRENFGLALEAGIIRFPPELPASGRPTTCSAGAALLVDTRIAVTGWAAIYGGVAGWSKAARHRLRHRFLGMARRPEACPLCGSPPAT